MVDVEGIHADLLTSPTAHCAENDADSRFEALKSISIRVQCF